MTIVPLSRSYVHSPWPIATFNVMSKPGGAGCNLACEYCFYRHHQDDGKVESRKQKAETGAEDPVCGGLIADGLLETFIADYIAAQDNPTVFFTWQGGEPTLAGLDFYRWVIELQKQHARTGVKIANALQTNGVLLDAQWCRFLAENQWAVGLSIDGPADIHDCFRRARGGVGSFAQVRAAADRLRRHNVPFDTLTTVTPANVNRVDELYEFLARELNAQSMQFQPCVERKDHRTVAPGYWPAETVLTVGDPRLKPRHRDEGAEAGRREKGDEDDDSIMTPWSITAEQWGRFLCQVFDIWWARDRERVIVNWFHSWASQFVGGSALMCICSPVCGRSVSMERDGSIYSCDHFVYPEYRLGVAGQRQGQLSELVRSDRQKRFGEAKTTSLPGYCRRCPFLFACNGECPKRRFLLTPDGEPGLNYLCPGYRVFFDHAGSRLAEYGRMLKSEQSHVGAVSAETPGVTYTYEDGADANGDARYRRLRYMTYPSGRVVYSIYEDTPAGRLVAQSEDAGGTQRIVEYNYLGMNTIVRESRPMVAGGLALSYGSGTTYAGFDRFGRVVGQEWRKTDDTLVDGYSYTYDRAGNRTSKTNLLNSAYSDTYGYDGLNRLVSATRNGTSLQGWELDSLGNWDSTTTSTGTQTREHNSANEITDISEGGVPAHDAVGNMTSVPTVSSYVTRMRYDAWNRLVSVEHEVAPDAWVEYACYGYDGLGRLVTTGHFPGTIDYYYNENHQFIEIRDDMPDYEYTEVSQFVWSLRYIDAPVMGYIETDREAVTTLVRQYCTQDANFNITASVDGATGAVMARAVYTPYGKRTGLGANWSGTGDVGRFGHQGLMEMRDSAGTGLYYNRARFYHPTLGRFIQRDPLGYVDGRNLYQYASSSPTDLQDPSGNWNDGLKKKIQDLGDAIWKLEILLSDARLRGFQETIEGLERKIAELKEELLRLAVLHPRAEMGHSDFPGSDCFDYTLEDNDPETGPYWDPERHFRDLPQSEADAQQAMDSCDRNAFQRAMHRGQDFFSHYFHGYRWPGTYGHVTGGHDPDNPELRWDDYWAAWIWTNDWVRKWNDSCGGCCDVAQP